MAASRRFTQLDFGEVLMATTFPLELLELRQTQGCVWVAAHANGNGKKETPVGFATASIVDGLGHLDELSVLPRHGRRGLGRRLVEQVIGWAHRSDLRAVTLSTLKDVPWNEPFYRTMGFRVLEPNELTDGLHRLRDAEARAGLPLERRVIMRRDI